MLRQMMEVGLLRTITKVKFIISLGTCILLTPVQPGVLGRAECRPPLESYLGNLILAPLWPFP